MSYCRGERSVNRHCGIFLCLFSRVYLPLSIKTRHSPCTRTYGGDYQAQRNVFSSSSGAEAAGQFQCYLFQFSPSLPTLQASFNMEVCRSQHSSAGSVKYASYPLNGHCTHAKLTTIALLVVRHLILAVATRFNLGVKSYVPCLLVRFSNIFCGTCR